MVCTSLAQASVCVAIFPGFLKIFRRTAYPSWLDDDHLGLADG